MNQSFSKIWIAIILAVVGIMAIVGGGFYAWQKSTKPSIALLSPNGGEIWTIGSTYTIRWTSQNIPQTDKISIHIRRVPPPPLPETGQEFDPIIFIELENTGSVNWTISDMYPVGNYIIEVNSYPSIPITKVISDESDASFRIESSSDEIADWKVYRNEGYGFELKYPKEWREPVETKRPYPAEGVLYSYLVEFYRSTGPGGFEVTIYEKPSDLDYAGLDEGVGLPQKDKEIPEVCPKPTRELSIGVENYPAKIVYVSPEDRCFRETYFYILQKGNYNYVLIPVPNGGSGIGYVGYDGKVETEKHLPEFNQILSTFKFIK